MKIKIAVAATFALWAGSSYAQTINKTSFSLVPNAAFISCLAIDGKTPPSATVGVVRDALNDTLVVHVTGLSLAFRIFAGPRLADSPEDVL
jgi:hypothetical protein